MVTEYPDAPGFKTTDTETSREAASSVKDNAATLRAKCLVVLKAGPSTADEIAAALGETVLAVRPRISELAKMGKAEPTTDRRKNVSGRSAVVWRAVVNGARLEQTKFL